MSGQRRRRRMLSPEEIEAIDPALIDSVTGDRLLHTVRELDEHLKWTSKMYNDLLTEKVALWLAHYQDDDVTEAAAWVTGGVDDWIENETLLDEWAHDWKLFLAAHRMDTREKRCNICGLPVTTWCSEWAACSDRHARAIKGQLPDEECRLCNTVKVCAHELDGSPVCADCWPGDRLLAERRARWERRVKEGL